MEGGYINDCSLGGGISTSQSVCLQPRLSQFTDCVPLDGLQRVLNQGSFAWEVCAVCTLYFYYLWGWELAV